MVRAPERRPRAESRGHAFGRASEEPYRRRSSDLARLVVAGLLLVPLVVRAADPVGATEFDAFLLFSSLPRELVPLFRVLQGLGTLWIVGLIAAASLAGRRRRLARDLILSGLLAWAVSRVLGSDVVGGVGFHASLRTLTHTGVTPTFPLVRLAVVVAVVVTAGPYVSRPTRRLGEALIVVLIFAGLYLGTALPTGLLGGLIVGWGIGAAVHLVFGSPGGRPSSWQLEATLPQIGITAGDVRLAAEQSPDSTVFDCLDGLGRRLEVKVIGRDERDAQLLAKTWRFVAYKEPSAPLQLSRYHQVEHEACMTLLARAAGVHVPEVLFVGRAGPSAGVLVLLPLAGRRLSDIGASEISDAVLADLWHQVARLHGACMAHGALDAAHVVVTAEAAGIMSFATASNTVSGDRPAKDVAELLAATAGIVGHQRAIAACVDVLGAGAVVGALPFLQPAALRAPTRSALSSHRRGLQVRLDDLREAAAVAAGVPPPALQQLQRMRPSSALLAVSSLVAVGVLLDQVGEPQQVWAIIEHVRWGWAIAALVFSLGTNLPYAVALMGTLRLRLPLWPTTELQLAMSYSNLVVPVVGGTGFQIRFLQRHGAELPVAVTAGGLLSLAGTVITQVPLFVVSLVLSPHHVELGDVSINRVLKLVLLVVFGVGAATAVALGIPKLRHAVLPPLRDAVHTIWTALRSPRQLSLIIGGNLLVTLLYGLCLLFCLFAFGGTLSFWSVLAISIGLGSLAALIPVPGGGTAVGAVGTTAALAGLGVPANVAVATTLVNQLVVGYLPAVPGWFATRHLLRQSDL